MTMFTVTAPLRLAGTALLFTLLSAGDLKLKENDHKAIGRLVSAYYTAVSEEKGILESMQKLLDQIQSKEKSLKGQKLLAAVGDWEEIFRLASEERLQPTLKKRGEPTAVKSKAESGIEVKFAYCVPKKPAKGALPLLLIACDSGEDPVAHLNTHWSDPALREAVVLMAIDLGKDTKSWGAFGDSAAPGGPYHMMSALGLISKEFSIDCNRRFLVGSGKGFIAAESTATSFPQHFAGVIGIGDVASSNIEYLGNFRTLPTLLAKCGKPATEGEEAKALDGAKAIETKIGELAFGNCTVNLEGAPAAVWEWIGKNPRSSYPAHITFSPKVDQALQLHWLSMVGLQASEGPRIEAKVDKATNTITIDAQKISDLVIRLNDNMVDLDKAVKFVVNGTTEERVLERNATEMVKNQFTNADWGRVFTAFYTIAVPTK
jgi:hypothetical protein